MKTKLLTFVSGFVIGFIIMAISVWIMMPNLMISVHESKYDVDRTTEEITNIALKSGWKIPKIYDIQKGLVKDGHGEMTKMRIMSLCQPIHAYNILKEDRNKKVSAIMPCRISVYEDSNGKTYITAMNVRLMSKMFGGTIEKVMAKVANEEDIMLGGVIK